MENTEIDEIKEILRIIKSQFKEFSDGYHDFNHGRTKGIKALGKKQMQNASDLMIYWIGRNEKVYKIASGGDKTEDVYRDDYLRSTFSGTLATYELQKIIDKIEELIPKYPEFKLNMSNSSDPRFTKKEIEEFLKSIYNESFSEICDFYYEPKYQNIIFNVKTDSIVNQKMFTDFLNDIENSKYGEYFSL
ncbi:hypothetical protein DBR39_18360 [Chryseobacterium sp. KBW03]|uniref:hypothetical protein n=1 Tax=Chryseobacterium sp. KBW03 TaxID=2153362 RepID=UPI000F59F90A|nr:hypothetical protein [Chryseobacterium sp. KBW03]RQO35440.1 hypothetical protein DBR39_18360 [Chryseobacterium sp. KBW03]